MNPPSRHLGQFPGAPVPAFNKQHSAPSLRNSPARRICQRGTALAPCQTLNSTNNFADLARHDSIFEAALREAENYLESGLIGQITPFVPPGKRLDPEVHLCSRHLVNGALASKLKSSNRNDSPLRPLTQQWRPGNEAAPFLSGPLGSWDDVSFALIRKPRGVSILPKLRLLLN